MDPVRGRGVLRVDLGSEAIKQEGVQGGGQRQHQASSRFQGQEVGSPQSRTQLRARLPGREEEVSGVESAIKSLQPDLCHAPLT